MLAAWGLVADQVSLPWFSSTATVLTCGQPSAKIDYQGFFGVVFFHAVPAETKQVENQIVDQSFFKVGSNSELAESPQH